MSEHIVIASDHGGIELKKELAEGRREGGYVIDDLGTHGHDAADYPDFAHQACAGIVSGEWARGILLCGTGVGMSMAANRHRGIRCVNCSDVFTARYSRAHNDANVLALGGRVIGFGLAWEIVKTWLTTPFSGDKRHLRRISKIDPA
jgi:ribose 5-phosphate isomerase B